MGAQYLVYNGPMQTTAKPAAVATGTSIKTMLQLKPGATVACKIIDWWIMFDGYAAAAPISVELIETDVAATVTAYVANDLTKFNAHALLNGDPTTALIAVGNTSSGYTSSSEGSITAVRNLAAPCLITPTAGQVIQLPLGREPIIQAGKFGRIRVHAGTTVNCLCGMTIEF